MLESEARFRLLVENVVDYAMYMLDADGNIISWNPGAQRIHGYRGDEIIGKHLSQFLSTGRRETWKGKGSAESGSDRPAGIEDESTRVRKDGSRFWASAVLTALKDEQGQLRGFVKVTRDITERKKADEAIRELNASLEQRVAERTEELVESNEALRQSNEDLNQFAYAASHDLQEPLRMVASVQRDAACVVFGRSWMPKRTNTSPTWSMARSAWSSFCAICWRIPKPETSSEGPAQPVDCAIVLEKVMLNLQTAIEQNGASVTWSDLPTVPAHEVRMVQLLQNLIGNAIKYRGLEPPKIHVHAERRQADWLFCVKDNGIGIDPEYAQQIFGVFKRLHGHNYPGTGIGLAICQRIIERYGGRIWVESTVGEGSRFYFTLPAVVEESLVGSSAS